MFHDLLRRRIQRPVIVTFHPYPYSFAVRHNSSAVILSSFAAFTDGRLESLGQSKNNIPLRLFVPAQGKQIIKFTG